MPLSELQSPPIRSATQGRRSFETGSLVALGALIGVLAFLGLGFWRVLAPHNVHWLLSHSLVEPYFDPATEFLGWHFLRRAPWGFPLGLNPAYGMEFSSSIVFTDSVPLFAFFFKIFAPLMGRNFQYLGFWMFCCLVLQGTFGMLLVRKLVPGMLAAIPAVILITLSPILIDCAWCEPQHMGHWLVLWALYLYLAGGSDRLRWVWMVVAALAVLSTFYLVPMVVIVWLADFAKRTIERWPDLKRRRFVVAMAAELPLVPLTVLLTMWVTGHFALSTSDVSTTDFGKFSMNVLGPIDSNGSSWLMQSQPKSPLNLSAGYMYFGLGMLLLSLMAIHEIIRQPVDRRTVVRFLPLCIAFAGLTAFSLSDKIAFGDTVWSIPHIWGRLGSIFRSSARMFWPVYYGAWLAVFFLVTRRLPAWRAALALWLALAIQLGEQWPTYKSMHQLFSSEQPWQSPLRDPFWTDAARIYRRVVVLPPGHPIAYVPLAYWAANNNMSTNAVYVNRFDNDKVGRVNADRIRSFIEGRVDPQMLFIVADDNMQAILNQGMKPEYGVGVIDGYHIIAPFWFENGKPAGSGPLHPGQRPH